MIRLCRAIVIYLLLLCPASMLFAEENIREPIINKNVHVIINTDPASCPRTWQGRASPASTYGMSGLGMNNGVATAGVQSCTKCAYDYQSKDCVCARCYSYYN